MGREACAQFVLLVETARTLITLWTVRTESTPRVTPKFATRYPDSQITLMTQGLTIRLSPRLTNNVLNPLSQCPLTMT